MLLWQAAEGGWWSSQTWRHDLCNLMPDQEVVMHPSEPRFSQKQISNHFRQDFELLLSKVIEDIASPTYWRTYQEFPPIQAVVHRGHLHTLDNRRLFIARVLARRGLLNSMRVLVVSKRSSHVLRLVVFNGSLVTKWRRAFRTPNYGRSVRVNLPDMYSSQASI